MTELQKKEFELLKYFIDICGKLNLRYYLVCGSALGAAKYKGFIPWDDDIDVAMPRDDYEVFLEKGSAFLPSYLFIQNYRTDPEFPMMMTKLRNSNTTFIEEMLKNIKMNHGVYIDIFPLDGYPKNKKEQKKIEREKKLFNRRRLVKCTYKRNFFDIHGIRAHTVYVLYKLFGYCKNISKTVERFERIAASYPCESSEIWCNHGNWQGKLDYSPKEWFGKGLNADFEGLRVIIPQKYDEYLIQKYGNWRADLPDEQKNSGHNIYICDLARPYTEFHID